MGHQKEALLVVWSVQMVLLSAISLRCLRTYWPVRGLLCGTFALGAMLSLDLWHLRPADSFTWRMVYTKYKNLWWGRTFGRWRFWRWTHRAKCPQKAQSRVLMNTLRENENTEYGLEYGLNKISNRESFRSLHPLTNYDDYREWVERVSDGHKKVMTNDDVIFMALTSGTTGKNKMFPLTASYAMLMGKFFTNVLYSFYPTLAIFKRTWEFRLLAAPRKLASGLPLGSASQLWGSPSLQNVVPSGVLIKVHREQPCFYAQALFVLNEPELGIVDAFSSDLLYSFFKFVEKNIDNLCSDIASGRYNSTNSLSFGAGDKDLESDTVEVINSSMSPNPGRAEFLKAQLKKGVEGFARRIWPDLEYVFLAKSGSFAHAYDILKKTFLKDIKIVTPAHGGTECFPGVNINVDKPDQDIYTLVMDVCFLEFIPLDEVDKENPETVFADQLARGESYEIVSTNCQGLYRYRTGDIIKVVDFFRSLPQYTFVDRLGQRLNLAFERTPETAIYQALTSEILFKWPHEVRMLDYTTTESTVIESITGNRSTEAQYVIFIEIDPADFSLPASFSEQVDAALCALHEPYKAYRDKGSIASLRLQQVASGTFEKLKNQLWGDHPNQQFKMPRVQRRAEHIQILISGRL